MKSKWAAKGQCSVSADGNKILIITIPILIFLFHSGSWLQLFLHQGCFWLGCQLPQSTLQHFHIKLANKPSQSRTLWSLWFRNLGFASVYKSMKTLALDFSIAWVEVSKVVQFGLLKLWQSESNSDSDIDVFTKWCFDGEEAVSENNLFLHCKSLKKSTVRINHM